MIFHHFSAKPTAFVLFPQHFFPAFRYLHYWLHAIDEHSLHSPFVFNFYTQIVKPDKQLPVFREIETYRKEKLIDNHIVKVSDLGASSAVQSGITRKVGSIARHSLSTAKFSRFLFRLASHLQPATIIELGTSLGINTLYLSAYHTACRVVTFEGCNASIAQAQSLFSRWGKNNIDLVSGNIDNTLPEYLSQNITIDMAYIDANHRYTPTLNYFNELLGHITPESVLVLDDIHWSCEMENAWQQIKQHESVTLTIDLFDAGLVFFKPMYTKQHYILSY